MASLYSNLGDYDKAFEWGARVIEERSPSAYLYNIDIFQALLSAMDFKKLKPVSKLPV